MVLRALRGFWLACSAGRRVAAFYAASKAPRADWPGLGAFDLGEEAAIARCPKARLTLFGTGRGSHMFQSRRTEETTMLL